MCPPCCVATQREHHRVFRWPVGSPFPYCRTSRPPNRPPTQERSAQEPLNLWPPSVYDDADLARQSDGTCDDAIRGPVTASIPRVDRTGDGGRSDGGGRTTGRC